MGLREQTSQPMLWTLLCPEQSHLWSLTQESLGSCQHLRVDRLFQDLASGETLSPITALGIWHSSLPLWVTAACRLCPQTHRPFLLQTLSDSQSGHGSLHLSHFFPLSRAKNPSLLFTCIRELHGTPSLQPLLEGSSSKVYKTLRDLPLALSWPHL